MFSRYFEQRSLRRSGLSVDKIHYGALVLANYSRVRFGDKIPYRCRVPVISPSHSASIVQTLLHNSPLAVRRHDEIVEVNLESVGDRIVVDTRSKSTRADKRFTIEAAILGNRSQFLRRVS